MVVDIFGWLFFERPIRHPGSEATVLPAFCFQSSLRLQCGTMVSTYLLSRFWNQDLIQYSFMNVFLSILQNSTKERFWGLFNENMMKNLFNYLKMTSMKNWTSFILCQNEAPTWAIKFIGILKISLSNCTNVTYMRTWGLVLTKF